MDNVRWENWHNGIIDSQKNEFLESKCYYTTGKIICFSQQAIETTYAENRRWLNLYVQQYILMQYSHIFPVETLHHLPKDTMKSL